MVWKPMAGVFWSLIKRVPFALGVLLLYVIAPCLNKIEICEHSGFWTVIGQDLYARGLRNGMFDYLWCYMSVADIQQALFHGIPQVLEDAYTIIRDTTTLQTSYSRKIRVDICALLDSACDSVVQPLFIFYASHEIGKSSLFGAKSTESAVLASLCLHLLQITFEKLEQATCNSGGAEIRFTRHLVMVFALAVLSDAKYAHKFVSDFRQSWHDAVGFRTLRKLAEKAFRRRCAAWDKAALVHQSLYQTLGVARLRASALMSQLL